MAVMTQDAQRPYRGVTEARITALPLAGYTNFAGGSTAHTVYKGSVVVCDVSDTDGYFRACPLSSSINLTTSDIFGGIAVEHAEVTSSNTADGSVSCAVARDGIWAFPVGAVAQTDVGAPAFASDDQTITTTNTNNLRVGYIVGVDSTYVYVEIEKAVGIANVNT